MFGEVLLGVLSVIKQDVQKQLRLSTALYGLFTVLTAFSHLRVADGRHLPFYDAGFGVGGVINVTTNILIAELWPEKKQEPQGLGYRIGGHARWFYCCRRNE